MQSSFYRILATLSLTAIMAFSALAQTQVGYNSITKPLPGNVSSEGFECCAVQEFGDGLQLTSGGTIGEVSLGMSSWACGSGNWVTGCVTKPGETFKQLIVLNIYAVDNAGMPAGSLGSLSQTFDIPYRPTSTPALCGGDVGAWFSKKDAGCFHGVATIISMNFSGMHIPVPANNKIIVTAAYNTTDFGPNPIGAAPCRSTLAGCPYDSLNVSADGNGGVVGAPIDTNGVYVRPAGVPYAYSACSGTLAAGVLALDTGCWAGYHPQIEVKVNTAKPPHTKGNRP